jgi:hypothetical protein
VPWTSRALQSGRPVGRPSWGDSPPADRHRTFTGNMERPVNHPGDLSTEPAAAERLRPAAELHARARAVELLQAGGIPFVVGGAYAFCQYTGIFRDTKDLDLFPRRADAAGALELLAANGWRTERTDEVWLYKAYLGEWFVDLIFCSGNGVADVDDAWFENAQRSNLFGHEVLIAPPEELIWSKAFVLERERYDGADVVHLLQATADRLDWHRLLGRFDRHWEVLLSHVLLYRFVYPGERSRVPPWVMAELLTRAGDSVSEGDWQERVCRGPLLSRANYVLDLAHWGYEDGRAWDERARGRGRGDAASVGSIPRGSSR